MSIEVGGLRGPTRPIAADIIAALMWGPKTVREIREITGASKEAIGAWLVAFEDAGVVYRKGREAAPLSEDGVRAAGERAVIFAMQPTPFANSSAPGTARRARRVHKHATKAVVPATV